MRNEAKALLRLCLGIGLISASSGAQVAITDTPDSVPNRGVSPTGQYTLSNIESVNAATGNLSLSIPLAHLPAGPGGFSAGVNLVYNSTIYDVEPAIPGGTTEEYNYVSSMHGGGWNYGYRYTLWVQPRFPLDFNLSGPCQQLGSVERQAWFKNLLETPDGGNHVLNLIWIIQGGVESNTSSLVQDPHNAYWQYDFAGNTSHSCGTNLPRFQGTLVFATSDSTYIRVEATVSNGSGTWIAYLPDGTQVTGPISTSNYAQDSDATQITDRNGNGLSIIPSCAEGSGCTENLTDAQGRAITIQYASNANGTWTDTLSWPGVNGSLTTSVSWSALTPDSTISYYPLVNPDGSTYTSFTEALSTNLNPLPSVVNSVELPPNLSGGNFTEFTFGYSSWGEVHSLAMSTGSTGNQTQQYNVSYTYCYDIGVNCPLETYPRPPATEVNPIQTKVLNYSELRDGLSPVPISETTSYTILGPTNAFTYPQTGTVGQVTYPDGSYSIIYTANACPSGFQSRDFCPALPYEILNRDGSVTKLGWANNTVPGGLPTSAIFNPYIQYRAYTPPSGSVSSAVQIAQDTNGNPTTVNEYDWMPNANVQEAAGTFVTGISGSAARTTTMTWNEQGQYGFYGNYGNKPNLRTRATASVGSVTIQYTYDDPFGTGNLTQVQQSDSGSECSPACPVSVTTSATYEGRGNISTLTDPNHYMTLICYDASSDPNNPYPADLYPSKRIVAAQPGASCANPTKLNEARETDYTNYADGSVHTATDADNSITTTYTYDDLGRTGSIEDKGTGASLGPSLDRVTSITYDDVADSVAVKSPTQTVTTFYDALGRVRKFVDGASDTVQKAYRFGNGVSYELESNAYGVPATDSMTQGWTLTTRDPMGRVTAVDHYPGTNAPGYSTAGGPVTLPPAAANNPPPAWGTAQTSASTGKATVAYNQSNSGCSGPTTNTTDEGGNTYVNCYDGLGRLIAVTEPPVNNMQTTASYIYDLLDNQVGVSLSGESTCTVSFNGQTASRCFAYSLSRLMSATNPEGGTTTYSYDNAGNVTGRKDANGSAASAVSATNPPGFTNSYDGLNRPYGWNYTTAANIAATPPVSYTYDQSLKGALSLVSTTNGTSTYSTSYTYDALGRIATSTQNVPGLPALKFSYGYSLTDHLTSMTYPTLGTGTGRQVKYALDAADRVQTVQNVTGGGSYATIGYTAPSGVASIAMGNGVTQQISWNDRLQQVGLSAASAQSTLLTLGFYPCASNQTACASNMGNVQSQTISFPAIGNVPGLNLTQNYTYDKVGRLSTAGEGSSSWSQSYGYTNGSYTNGNRYVSANAGFSLSASTPTVASNFDSRNRLNVNNAAYDNGVANGNGNQTAIGGYAYTYDAENRMVNAVQSAGATLLSSAGYVYDGLAQRVQKMTCYSSNPCTPSSTDATITTYVYDAFGNLAQEYGPSYSLIAWCGTPTCYLTQDQIGSTRLVTDANGLVGWRFDYLPFGEELVVGTGGRTAAMGYDYLANGFNPKFAGQMWDPESARDYMHFRYYSPQEGRFVSVDPGNAGADAGTPQTWNGYSYVVNNPLNYTDPNGMFLSATAVGASTGNPVGVIIGGLIDLGSILAGLFGGGGPSLPKWSDTAWGLGPLQPSPDIDWQQMPESTIRDDASDLSGSWGERLPIRGSGGLLNTSVASGGGSLASILGIEMPNPFVLSANPADQIQGIWEALQEHLGKIAAEPNNVQAVEFWQKEIRGMARRILTKAEQVTKNRRAGALEKYLQRTIGVSADELDKFLRTPIIFIDTCKLDPYQPVCLGGRSSGAIY